MDMRDTLLLCCCFLCFTPWIVKADCLLDNNLLGSWNIQYPNGNITFGMSRIRAVLDSKDYDFVCADKDWDGKYLLKTPDGKRMLCILISSFSDSSIILVKLNAGHFDKVDDVFKSDHIPTGFVPDIDTCDSISSDIYIVLEPMRK